MPTASATKPERFDGARTSVVDSGIPDLASNPEHLEGFGRDARHR
jgi:hypothetical protein